MAQPPLFCRPTGIYSLPVELLTRIFVLGSAFDYPYTDSPFLLKPDQEYEPPTSSNLQVVVSHVSRYWRQVALRTHSLWTTLHFRETCHISRAETYLARCLPSSTYLLDILVDTIAQEDHTPGITLYTDEIKAIFQIIIPHVSRWRAFHLKICDNQCKGLARQFLSTCGPAPNLETLQLYHFEDYRTSQRLYLATYMPPVVVFSNSLPCLKNVSLIGVNLPWADSPYLANLHHLELALHLDNIRPPYKWWDRMLRLSPDLKRLSLHYSGPRKATDDPTFVWPGDTEDKIQLTSLWELCLTDLDSDYLCNMFQHLILPAVKTISLDLPEQNFTPFIEMIAAGGQPSSMSPSSSSWPIPSLAILDTLIIHALNCSPDSWRTLLRALKGLRFFDVDFTRVGSKFWDVFNDGAREEGFTHDHDKSDVLLPSLEVFKIAGISGKDIICAIRHRHRRKFLLQGKSLPERWIVKWNERLRNRDPELDSLVDEGCCVVNGTRVTVETFDEEDEEVEDIDEGRTNGDENADCDGEETNRDE
jgi:F-box-like